LPSLGQACPSVAPALAAESVEAHHSKYLASLDIPKLSGFNKVSVARAHLAENDRL
jgi:hypothetical protein